jgi:uncharacterized protein YaaQ
LAGNQEFKSLSDVQLTSRKPKVTQIAAGLTITPGSTSTLNTVTDADVDQSTFLATCSVSHTFRLRLIQRIAPVATDANAYIEDAITGASVVNSINRVTIKTQNVIEYRLNNQDTVDRVYNAWKEEWVR